MYQTVGQLLEFGAGQCFYQVLRHTVHRHDVGQVYFGRGRTREFDFGFFGCLFQTLQCHRVLAQIDAFVLLEFVGQPIDDDVVEIVAAEVRVAVGRFYFEYAVAEFKNRNIERAAAEVEYGDFHIFVRFVETVSQGGCGGLVDDTAHFQTCNLAGLFGGLTLSVAEVCRHGDDGFVHLLTEIIFGGFFHFLQNHGRNFLRRVQPTVNIDARRVVVAFHHFVWYAFNLFAYAVVGFAHETLDRIDSFVRVRNCLTFSRIAHFAFATVDESHDGRCCAFAFAVGYYDRFISFEDSHTRVGCA